MAVTQGSLRRAMRILNSLIKALESQRCAVRVGKRFGFQATIAKVEGESVPFSLKEETRRSERDLTPRERLEKKKYSWFHRTPKYVYSPSGVLVLQTEIRRLPGIRRRWADGKKQRLEDLLPAFVVSIFDYADHEKQRRAEDEEAERRREKKEREREAKRKLIAEEQERLNKLLSAVDSWHRSRRVREYVSDVVERVEAAHGPLPQDHPFFEWVAWAEVQADRLDPLIEGPPSILDE